MMRLFLLVLLFPCFAFAQDHALTVDLAEDYVDITTGFNGAHLVLFGVKNAGGDVAIVIRGPEKDMTVRKKSRVVGAWMNRSSLRFKDVPVFYDYALSVPDEDMLSADVREDAEIGVKVLDFDVAEGDVSSVQKQGFLKALIRNKTLEKRFPEKAREITFLSDSFFRSEFYMPANLPTGQYVIETFLLKGERVVDKRVTNLKVAQVGFAANVHKFAKKQAFLYAIVMVVFAVFAGWVSNVVRRRR
ncbi:MAG: TIGR02186 family protein [Alphaproteobacteria bacterium]